MASTAAHAEAPAAQKQVVPDAHAPAAKLQQALELAKLVDPEDVSVEVALANYKAGLLDGLSKGQGVAKFDAEHPGIIAKMIDGARPILAADVHKRLPDLWHRMAEVYARELSSEEIAQLTALFRTAFGRKLIQNSVPEVEFPAGVTDPRPYNHESLTGSDVAELANFEGSDPGKVMERVAPAINKVRDAWSEESDPEYEKALMDSAASVMNELISEPSDGK